MADIGIALRPPVDYITISVDITGTNTMQKMHWRRWVQQILTVYMAMTPPQQQRHRLRLILDLTSLLALIIQQRR
jgi:phosphatidylethanolamine-binding protein (PEBP) family uncharacterized protein